MAEDQVMAEAPVVNAFWGKIATATTQTLSFAAAGRALSPGLEAQTTFYGSKLSHPSAAVHLATSFNEILSLVPLPYQAATAPLLNRAKRLCKDFADVRASHNRLCQCSHKGQVPVELAGVHAPNYQYLAGFEQGKAVADKLRDTHEAFIKSSLDAMISAKALELKSCELALEPKSYAGLIQGSLTPVFKGLAKHRHALTFDREGEELVPRYEDNETDAKHEFDLAIVTVGRAMTRMIQLELAKADDLWSKSEAKKVLADEAALKAGDGPSAESAKYRKAAREEMHAMGLSKRTVSRLTAPKNQPSVKRKPTAHATRPTPAPSSGPARTPKTTPAARKSPYQKGPSATSARKTAKTQQKGKRKEMSTPGSAPTSVKGPSKKFAKTPAGGKRTSKSATGGKR